MLSADVLILLSGGDVVNVMFAALMGSFSLGMVSGSGLLSKAVLDSGGNPTINS
jgi:hypothetical protein